MVPLYSDDTGRIPSAYRRALLDQFTNVGSLQKQLSYLKLYASTFSHPIAITALAPRFLASPNSDALFDLALKRSTDADGDIALFHLLVDLNDEIRATNGIVLNTHIKNASAAKVTAYKQQKRARTLRPNPAGPYHWQVITQGNLSYFGVPTPCPPCIALFLDCTTPLDSYDFSLLKGVERVIVVPTSFDFTDERIETLGNSLEEVGISKAKIEVQSCLRTRMAPYSEAETEVSAFCDRVSEKLFRFAATAAERTSPLHPAIRKTLSLNLSDGLYRAAQSYVATLKIAHSLRDANADIGFVTTNHDYAGALSLLRPCWLVSHRVPPQSALSPTAPPLLNKELLLTTAMLDLKPEIDAAVARYFASPTKRPQIIIATNTRMATYRKAVDIVQPELSSYFEVLKLDFAPQKQEKTASLNSDEYLYGLLRKCDERLALTAKNTIRILLSRSLNDMEVGGLPARFVYRTLSAAAVRLCESQISLFREFSVLRSHFSKAPPALLLAIPGRVAQVRCAIQAAKAEGVPTADLQCLFVSRMPRYRAPITDHVLAMDRQTARLYTEHFGVEAEDIEVVGSLLLDDELASIKTKNMKKTAAMRPEFTKNCDVFTYALQTLPEATLFSWTQALATALSKRKDVALCIKLHPGHSASLREKLKTLLSDFPNLPSRTYHNTPLTDVLGFSDVLLTHYSNVGITARAMGIPVLSLPAPDGLQGIDLSELGISTPVNSEEDLNEKLGLALTGNQASPYFSENLEMGDGAALSRVLKAIRAAAELTS